MGAIVAFNEAPAEKVRAWWSQAHRVYPATAQTDTKNACLLHEVELIDDRQSFVADYSSRYWHR